MLRKHPASALRRCCPLGILGLALLASSCGHNRESAAAVPVTMDAVMKTIHDYGRGHNALLSPGINVMPDETDNLYSAHIATLLAQEDFAQLEKIAQQDRVEKGRLLGGIWKIHSFYDGTGMPVSAAQPDFEDYTQQIARLQKWIAAYPDSATARISLGYLYLNYASFARGTGFADSVSDAQWDLFHSRLAQAKTLLLEAATLKDKDPFWYQAMLIVALHEGWSKAQAHELFEQASAFEPGFYHYYRQYALYLLPRWYGQSGDIQAFGEEILKRVPEPDGSMLYFQITSTVACYCEEDMHELPHANYPILRQGYGNITRFYGVSNLNANRFAFMATSFGDQQSAQEAFAAIDTMDSKIWYTEEVYNRYRAWAEAP